MCYDIQQMGDKIRRQAERQLGVSSVDFSQMDFHFFHVNGFARPEILAVTSDQPQLLRPLRWGLIPSWVKTAEEADRLSRQTLNARNDGVFSKPSFRSSIRTRRCLIPVNGFYENRDVKGRKFPYFVHPANSEIFWLGGLFDRWTDRDSGEVIDSCSIITTNANHLMSKIHNLKLRMPLIIPEDKLLIWLDPDLPDESIQQLMQPYPEKEMEAYTVSKLVNRKRDHTNMEEVSMPFRYPELEYLDTQR